MLDKQGNMKQNNGVTIRVKRLIYERSLTMKNRRFMYAVLVLALGVIMTLCLAGCIQVQQPAQEQSTETQTEQPATDTTAPATDNSGGSNDNYIGEDKALEIALADAGLSSGQVSNANAHLDYDDDRGRYEYEVKFYQGTTEYDYDVDAITGDITDKDIDYDND